MSKKKIYYGVEGERRARIDAAGMRADCYPDAHLEQYTHNSVVVALHKAGCECGACPYIEEGKTV